MNLTLSIFRVIRDALEKGPWTRPPQFFEEAPKHAKFSTAFDGVTGYMTIEGSLYKVTIVREMRL